jgi:hypothetical protein
MVVVVVMVVVELWLFLVVRSCRAALVGNSGSMPTASSSEKKQ